MDIGKHVTKSMDESFQQSVNIDSNCGLPYDLCFIGLKTIPTSHLFT